MICSECFECQPTSAFVRTPWGVLCRDCAQARASVGCGFEPSQVFPKAIHDKMAPALIKYAAVREKAMRRSVLEAMAPRNVSPQAIDAYQREMDEAVASSVGGR